MAESSRFWTTNNTGDGPSGGYGADKMQEALRGLLAIGDAGVCRGRGNELAVTTGSGQVTVATGEALVYGCYYTNDSTLAVTVSTPTTATRQDRIILRFGSVAQTVRCVRLAGTEGGGLPTLTQTSTIWELQIASISTTTGGTITVTNDTARFLKSPGALSVADESTLTYNGGAKTLGVKNSGLSGTQIASPLSLSQYVATASGGGTSAGIYINSTSPGIGFNESDAAADEKLWDININAKTFFFRAINDAQNSATNIFQIVRGTGAAIASFTIGTALTIGGALSGITAAFSGALTAASAAFTGQITSTQNGGGTTGGLYINSAVPGIGLRESDQGVDEKLWDVVVEAKALSVRTINDASSSAVSPLVITRGTGTAISGIALNGNTSITGTLGVSGAIVGNLTGNASTATIASGVTANSIDDTMVGNRVPQFNRRQGGSSTDWSSAGTGNFWPDAVRMQAGSASIVLPGGGGEGSVTVTYPASFSNTPLVFCQINAGIANIHVTTRLSSLGTSSVTITAIAGTGGTVTVNWFAVGAE